MQTGTLKAKRTAENISAAIPPTPSKTTLKTGRQRRANATRPDLCQRGVKHAVMTPQNAAITVTAKYETSRPPALIIAERE
jgi:hypothetical protein